MADLDWGRIALGDHFPAGDRPRRRVISRCQIGPLIALMTRGEDGALYGERGQVGTAVEIERGPRE